MQFNHIFVQGFFIVERSTNTHKVSVIWANKMASETCQLLPLFGLVTWGSLAAWAYEVRNTQALACVHSSACLFRGSNNKIATTTCSFKFLFCFVSFAFPLFRFCRGCCCYVVSRTGQCQEIHEIWSLDSHHCVYPIHQTNLIVSLVICTIICAWKIDGMSKWTIVCQLVLWWMKTVSHIISISDRAAKIAALCWVINHH